MPETDLADHRQSPARVLLDALARGEPLALAEAYYRSAPAAHAVAARLVGSPREVEMLLRDVYADLWRDPPADPPLEAWVRQRTFALGRDRLLADGRAASSPSAALLLGEDEVRNRGDRPEQAIATLDDDALRALLLAHDRGTPTAEQDAADAPRDLRRALLALAEADDVDGCDEPRLADFVLGLLDNDDDQAVTEAIASRAPCAELAKDLRRGRRRLGGLPPPPDMGQRVVAHVLATAGALAAAGSAPPAEPEAEPGSATGAELWTDPQAEPETEHASESAAEPAGGEPLHGGVGVGTGEPGELAGKEPGELAGGKPLADVSSDAPAETAPSEPDAAARMPAGQPEDSSEAATAAAGAAVAGDGDPDAAGAGSEEAGGAGSAGPDEATGALDVIDGTQGGADEQVVADPPAQDPAEGSSESPPEDPSGVDREPVAVGGEPQPAPPAAPADERRDGWGEAPPADEDHRLDGLSLDESHGEALTQGRRVGTILLTILGALLLLAAGGIAGLLLVRVVLS